MAIHLFLPVSSLVEHGLFSSLSLRGNDGTVFNGGSPVAVGGMMTQCG